MFCTNPFPPVQYASVIVDDDKRTTWQSHTHHENTRVPPAPQFGIEATENHVSTEHVTLPLDTDVIAVPALHILFV